MISRYGNTLAGQQASPKAAPAKACVCGEPQASGTVHRVDGPCYVAAPQPAPAPLSRDQIREVFMTHGFTIKEGQTDLKQYVYDAAYALLWTKPAPLSEREAFEAWFRQEYHSRLDRNMPDKSYNDPKAYTMWIAWQARAALKAQGENT